MFNVRDKIEAMIKKSKLWVDCMNNNKTEVFPSLHDFLSENHLGVTDSVKRDITMHLSELAAQLRRYATSPKLTSRTVGFVIPFLLCLLPYRHLNRRASLKSQQVDPLKLNSTRSLCQIS